MKLPTLAMLLALMLCAGVAHGAELTVSTARTSPGLRATLPLNQPFYAEIVYSSDVALRFQARAYRSGVSLDAGQMMNGAPAHPPGKGSALVWVGYNEPATIDEIRITVYGADWKPVQIRSLKAGLQWGGQAAGPGHGPPAWVRTLQEQEERLSALQQPEYGDGGDWFFALLPMFMLVSIPGYAILQTIAVKRFRGGWRWAGMAPLLLTVPAALHATFALAAGSNLWPIILIFAAPLAFIYLLVVTLLRFAMAR